MTDQPMAPATHRRRIGRYRWHYDTAVRRGRRWGLDDNNRGVFMCRNPWRAWRSLRRARRAGR